MLLVILVAVAAILIVGGLGLIAGTRSRRRRIPGSADSAGSGGSGESITGELARRSADSSSKAAPAADAVSGESSVATLAAPEQRPEQRDAVEKEPPGRHDLYGGMGKSRGLISGYLKSLRSRAALNDSIWDEMEEALLGSDVGLRTSDAVLESLREKVKEGTIKDTASILPALKAEILSYLTSNDHPTAPTPAAAPPTDATGSAPAHSSNDRPAAPPTDAAAHSSNDRPAAPTPAAAGSAPALAPANVSPGRSLRFDEGVANVWLFVGVNGVGKTTTIGKVALSQAGMGRSVILAAGDTFRAAAGEQLEIWGERAGAEVVRGKEGGDPGAVVFDAVERARAKGYDLVLADTAGRLHTNVNLVEELKKIYRVAARSAEVVSEVLLVLDATTGQNGLVQARQFTDAVGVTGIILTKLDGTARGGIVVAIERELGIPVKMVGIGEGVHDLIPFDPHEFVEALFG